MRRLAVFIPGNRFRPPPVVRAMLPRTISATRTRAGCEIRLLSYGPGAVQRRHAHDRASLTLVLRGDLVERIGTGEERASALSVVAKPAHFEHANAFGPAGVTTLQVELPAGEPWVEPDASPGPHGSRWHHAGPACRALLRLLSIVSPAASPAPDGEDPDALVAEGLAAFDRAGPSPGAPPRWLREVLEALAEESTPVSELARRAGVHPVHLARRFRAHFGITPSEHRRRMRLHRAARTLAMASEPLALVALDAGYCDQPHMSHEFRAATGLTPRGLRQLTAGVGA